MGSLLRDSRPPPQVVLGIIEGYLHRVARPEYVGAISLFIGWSLERTQQMLELMQDRGIVCKLTREELKAGGFLDHRSDANVWRLVDEPSPAKARW